MTNKQSQITINAIKFLLDNAQYSEDVEEALNMAISALEERRWIPCSEKLPVAKYGESDNVLATCGHRDGDETSIRWIRTLYFNGGVWCYPTGETYDQKVYAWMPLPEAYREGEA